MTQTDQASAGGEHPVPNEMQRTAGGYRGPALWLAIVAVVAPAAYFQSFLAVAVGALLGIAAVILALVARRRGVRGRALAWALALGVIGAVVDTVLVGIVLVLLFGSIPSDVELQAEGGQDFTVTFSDDSEDHSEVWDTSWFGKFNTTGSSAEITVTPSAEGAGETHTCRIFWNDKVVAMESSDSGAVTCRYERWPF